MEGNVLETATKYCNDYNYNRTVLNKFFSSLDKPPTENQTQPQATSPTPVNFMLLYRFMLSIIKRCWKEFDIIIKISTRNDALGIMYPDIMYPTTTNITIRDGERYRYYTPLHLCCPASILSSNAQYKYVNINTIFIFDMYR